jgi:hypothetical protein
MRILAIDPGKTTGFSFAEVTEFIRGEPPEEQGVVSWEKEVNHDELIEEILDVWPTHLVGESFVHTQRSNVDYTPVEYIGIIKWLGQRHKFELTLQTPSYGKGFFNDDKLKKLGLYTKGKPHANDATRHRLQYQMKNNWFDLNRLKK